LLGGGDGVCVAGVGVFLVQATISRVSPTTTTFDNGSFIILVLLYNYLPGAYTASV
jgi:hypothetical protein